MFMLRDCFAIRPVFMRCLQRILLGPVLCLAGVALPAYATPLAETCLKVGESLGLGARLPVVAGRLKAGEAVKVVAIGSSSTRGVGASSWAATYPEVMQRELQRLAPRSIVHAVNSGVNGETIPGQIGRIESDVIALNPDLVIWQLGANDVIFRFGSLPDDLEGQVVEAVRRIRENGSDVILMDLQYAPVVTSASTHRPMIDLIGRAARRGMAGLFRRFELMEQSVAKGVALSDLTSWDKLHSTDAAYDCVGRALARAIHKAAR